MTVVERAREADLLVAATRLFRQRGFHATSMQELGEALGMNRGSLYHYIASKDDLLWSILNRAFDLLDARVLPLLDADEPPLPRLAAGIREHLRVAADHADELSLIQIELRSLPLERRAMMIERRDAYEARWRSVIEQAIADGALRPVDVRLTGIGILSICNWFTQWYRPDGPQGVDEIAAIFTDLLLAGSLRRPDASATAQAVPE
ncbi:MAG TPA: TetR/AcrR family transcriptional regulator [Candidatus Limnocylindria bacterium]|nr:TetR/AcrR family transcriptional regulator [Candidatus Limnocylindria bacterium]